MAVPGEEDSGGRREVPKGVGVVVCRCKCLVDKRYLCVGRC